MSHTNIQKMVGVMVVAGLLGLATHMAFAQMLSNTTTDTTSSTTTHVAPLKDLLTRVFVEGGVSIVDGTTTILIKVNDSAISVELRAPRTGTTDLHIGQAIYDHNNNRWFYQWDTTQAPDGQYRVVAFVTRRGGVLERGDGAVLLTVKNDEVVTPETVATPSVPTTVNTAKRVDEYRQAQQKRRESARREFANALKVSAKKNAKEQGVTEKIVFQNTLTSGPTARPTPVDFEKVVNEKSQDIKYAIESGDEKKRKEVIAEIVRIAQVGSSVTPEVTAELVKKVEEGVAMIEKVIIEEQKGTIDTQNFVVNAVEVAEIKTNPDGTKTASKIKFSGKALPNSFATLYIYSLPIVVTVKTDSEGNWNYTLDKELEDGKHIVYVAVADVKGQVVARSNPLPFIKEASAVTLSEIQPIPVAEAAPSFTDNSYFYGIITIILLVLVMVFVIMGIKLSRNTPISETDNNTDNNNNNQQ